MIATHFPAIALGDLVESLPILANFVTLNLEFTKTVFPNRNWFTLKQVVPYLNSCNLPKHLKNQCFHPPAIPVKRPQFGAETARNSTCGLAHQKHNI